MNNIISKINAILMTFGVIFMFSSCDKEDYTGGSTLNASDPTFTITWETALPSSQVEGTASYPFTITLSEPQVVDLRIKLDPTDASTATIGDDYDVTREIVISAYRTEGSGVLTVYGDVLPEETETVSFQVGGTSTANMSHSEVVTLDLENLVEEGLLVVFDWDDVIDVTIGGTTYQGVGLCANVDIDILLADETGAPFAYAAATENCPEIFAVDPAAIGDGTFYLVGQLYANGGVAPDSGPIPFPITTTIAETGIVYIPVKQDASNYLMSDFADDVFTPLLKLVVTGNSISFYDVVTDELIYSV